MTFVDHQLLSKYYGGLFALFSSSDLDGCGILRHPVSVAFRRSSRLVEICPMSVIDMQTRDAVSILAIP